MVAKLVYKIGLGGLFMLLASEAFASKFKGYSTSSDTVSHIRHGIPVRYVETQSKILILLHNDLVFYIFPKNNTASQITTFLNKAISRKSQVRLTVDTPTAQVLWLESEDR